ncbi:hypothetical protein SeLEV6574_g02588 [Synchytrium endobioticum]|uniref:Uncharacterized protein n=1 Tax=Synchytrium endobioticum TaxID=286115 RepID=A0A507D9K2_9FUNG|nr:hypothetical protein SeLEV6574_g02588 [Synchytrium endobioticum]
MFRSVILLLSLALCHQAISVGPSEPSGHHELRANELSAEDDPYVSLWNLLPVYDPPQGNQGQNIILEERSEILCYLENKANEKEMEMRLQGRMLLPFYIGKAVETFANGNARDLRLHFLNDISGQVYDTKLKMFAKNVAAAELRVLLRVLLNTYKFYDLKNPDSPLSDATRKQLLCELKAGTQRLQGYAIEDDGLGYKGFTALVDDWTSVIEPIETLLREEKVKLGLPESCSDADVASLLWQEYPDDSDVPRSIMLETNRKIMEELERVFGDITVNHVLSWPEDVLHRLRRIPELPGFKMAIHSGRCIPLMRMPELAPFISQCSSNTGPSVPSTASGRRSDIVEPSSRVLRSHRKLGSSTGASSSRSTGGRRGRSLRD